MSLVAWHRDTYAASFTPGSLADYTYQVLATNDSGGSSQSAVHTLTVVDTTPPAWRSQAQTHASILVGEANSLSAEGLDIGGLEWATLATNESGVWQEFTWPVSDWWDPTWLHRVPILVTEPAGIARTAETVDVLVSSAQFTGLANCAAELRVADAAKHELPVQVYGESSSGGTLTCHLLFQANLAANESRTYYIYYGNPAATAPAYTTDLASSTVGNLLNVHNTFLNLDLDTSSGIVSRVQLPTGTNTNLPLSTQTNSYWGWHQVCSSLDGNITGKNSLCSGGTAPATGLVLTTLIDGPIVKEFEFTSQKGAATYRMTYRFFANAPYYQYGLAVTGTTANVMNNYWYTNGSFSRLGAGTGGTPASTYNTYASGVDQIRIASLDTTIQFATIDGGDNDGTQLGGADYRFPSASGLDLWVTTGASQADTELVLGRLAEPAAAVLGSQVEDAPETQYGSPANLNSAVAWTPAAFLWQNPAIPAGTDVQWRIKFCDLSGNCASTADMTFSVAAPNTPPVAVGDSYTTAEDVPLSVSAPGVLANDTDGDADPLTAHLVTDAAHGNLTLNPDGSFSYTPDPGYFGPDSFTYKANDGAADSNEAAVSITVNESTPPPILPASFYGAAHFNDHAPTAGDLVLASLPGVAFSTPLVVQPDLSLTYAIDLPGDLPDTPEIEGGVEGSPITFSINCRLVAAAVWHSGTNSRLDFHPPAAALALAAEPANEGAPFTLSAAASTDWGGDIASFAFDCDGDSTFELGPQAGSSATCPALDDGPHTVGVSLLDAQGGSGSTTLDFTAADVAPTANAGGPYSGIAGQPLTLSGSFTCPSTDSCTSAWDLDGDGSFGETGETGLTPSFTWNISYDYIVSLRVSDDDGNSIISDASVHIAYATHSIVLLQGWNLVSFSLIPPSDTPTLALASLGSAYDLVYAWDALTQSWRKLDRTAPPYASNLTHLDHKMGFWIHLLQPATLAIQGDVPTSTSIALHPGWNLAGYPGSLTPQSARRTVRLRRGHEFLAGLRLPGCRPRQPMEAFRPDHPPFLCQRPDRPLRRLGLLGQGYCQLHLGRALLTLIAPDYPWRAQMCALQDI